MDRVVWEGSVGEERFNWTLKMSGICGRGERGTVSVSGKGSLCTGNSEKTNSQVRDGSSQHKAKQPNCGIVGPGGRRRE